MKAAVSTNAIPVAMPAWAPGIARVAPRRESATKALGKAVRKLETRA